MSRNAHPFQSPFWHKKYKNPELLRRQQTRRVLHRRVLVQVLAPMLLPELRRGLCPPELPEYELHRGPRPQKLLPPVPVAPGRCRQLGSQAMPLTSVRCPLARALLARASP